MLTATNILNGNRIAIILASLLLSGCANIKQLINNDDATVQQLQSQLTKQHEQMDLLAQQQDDILTALQQQPVLFASQSAQITSLNERIDAYLQQHNDGEQAMPATDTDNSADNMVGVVDSATSTTPVAEALYAVDKPIIGSEEMVLLGDQKIQVKARIDTGATTSSLNATDIVEFERDGKKWIRFNFNIDETQPPQVIEAQIARTILIRQANDTEATRRPIIELPIQLGNIKALTKFTLADRSHMNFPLLLGRTFLKDMVIVDVAKRYALSDDETIQ